jgi:hypothetical protein
VVAPPVPRDGDGPHDLEDFDPLLAQPALVEHLGGLGEVGIGQEGLHR